MKRVLVLDANQRSALAVTRSLGKQGIPVITAEESSCALAGSSRFSQQHLEYPSPGKSPDQFVEVLGELVREHRIDILLPMTELTTALLLANQAAFPGAILPFPDKETVDSLANKCTLMRMAQELDIPTPRTWYVDNPGSLPVDLDEIAYPVVLKPGESWLVRKGLWNRVAVRLARNPADARDILDKDTAFHAHPFMIQEYIEGHGEGIFALYNQGEPVVFFAHRRLREKPPRGGVSVLSRSVEVDPILRSHAASLLNQTKWHGVAMVEFKVSSDGAPYLMEVNTRLWGSLQLAVDAGVDFPWLLYQLACGKQPESIDSYKIGTQLRWLLGDMDNLYLTLRDKHYSYSDKLGTIRRFLTPSPFKTKHEINRWGDLRPAWYEVKQYLQDIIT